MCPIGSIQSLLIFMQGRINATKVFFCQFSVRLQVPNINSLLLTSRGSACQLLAQGIEACQVEHHSSQYCKNSVRTHFIFNLEGIRKVVFILTTRTCYHSENLPRALELFQATERNRLVCVSRLENVKSSAHFSTTTIFSR